MLYRETIEAYEYFQEHPEMSVIVGDKEYKVCFDIMVFNASCNKIRDKFAINGLAAYYFTQNPLEDRKNKEGLDKLEKKINALEKKCQFSKRDQILLDSPSSDKWVNDVEKLADQKEKVLQVKMMRDLLHEIREMLLVNDAEKTKEFAYNYYALAARWQLLLRLLDINTNKGCRSNKDRTGLSIIEYFLLVILCYEKSRLIKYQEVESQEEGSWSDEETCKKHADRFRAEIFIKSGNVKEIPERTLGFNIGMNLGGASNPDEHGETNKQMSNAAFAAAEVYHRPNSGDAKYETFQLWDGQSQRQIRRMATPPFNLLDFLNPFR